MAAFSYHHSPLMYDSILVPNISNNMSSLLEQGTIRLTYFSTIGPDNDHRHEIPLQLSPHQTSSLETGKEFSSMVHEPESNNGDPDNKVAVSLERKRKKTESKVKRGDKVKKKISDDEMKKMKEKKIKADTKKEEKKVNKGAQSEYIHVRARRGQATDSHSLAERVRREKISERMKFLQSLVPGCDKITGKAQILDEIINYVQSLQNQVEVMVEKLAALGPVFNDFVSLDTPIPATEKYAPVLSLPSLLQTTCSENEMMHFAETRPFPFLNQEAQNQDFIFQDNGIPTWGIIDQHALQNLVHF